MGFAKHQPVAVTDSIAQQHQLGAALVAMQKHRCRLGAATTGTLA
jgi:hypothetical protein